MKTVTPDVSVTALDTNSSPFPNEPMLAGAPLTCPAGAVGQDVKLAAASSNVALPFPTGVTTAVVIAIIASNVADLIVTYKGQTMSVPAGQAAFFYGVTSANISVSTVLGGSIQCLVGG